MKADNTKSNENKEKYSIRKQLGIKGIVGLSCSLIIMVISWLIGIYYIISPSRILVTGWILILVGAPWLLLIITISPSLEINESQSTISTLAVFTTFVFIGLALLSRLELISVLFIIMSIFCFLFGYLIGKVQPFINSKKN
jgi:uncharacterized membrane protein